MSMKFRKYFRIIQLSFLSFFIAISVPVSVFAEDTPTPAASTQAQATTDVQAADTTTLAAQSGTATVDANATAGNAASGNATASATTITSVNSTAPLGNTATQATFSKDVTGDVIGDITLAPTIRDSLQSLAVNNTPAVSNNPVVVTNIDTSHAIIVSAITGNATVSNNSLAGNAITGDARAVANSITIANSALASQGSYIGTINIYGNLNGDILIAPDFTPQLVTATSTSNPLTTTASSSSTQTITNEVSLSATSGDATVSNNSTAGSATTGNATTNLVIYSVVGQQLTANNSLLVFVNVLGKWVGNIIAAPEGATTAFLANGITKNTATPVVVNIDTQTNITNKLIVTAQSGNALVTNNATAGGATSGKATASANILTLSQDNMNLSGWLGVLFINVYGNWLGSFGINTTNGDPLVVITPADPSSIPASSGGDQAEPILAVASFTPRIKPTSTEAIVTHDTTPLATAQSTINDKAILGATTTATPSTRVQGATLPLYLIPGLVLIILGLAYAFFRRFQTR